MSTTPSRTHSYIPLCPLLMITEIRFDAIMAHRSVAECNWGTEVENNSDLYRSSEERNLYDTYIISTFNDFIYQSD